MSPSATTTASVTRTIRLPKDLHSKAASQHAEEKAALRAKYGVTFTPRLVDDADDEVEVIIEGPSDEVIDQLFVDLQQWAPQ